MIRYDYLFLFSSLYFIFRILDFQAGQSGEWNFYSGLGCNSNNYIILRVRQLRMATYFARVDYTRRHNTRTCLCQKIIGNLVVIAPRHALLVAKPVLRHISRWMAYLSKLIIVGMSRRSTICADQKRTHFTSVLRGRGKENPSSASCERRPAFRFLRYRISIFNNTVGTYDRYFETFELSLFFALEIPRLLYEIPFKMRSKASL